MKGVALQASSLGGDIEKAGVEVRIVADQHRSIALVCFNSQSDNTEKLAQRDGFGYRPPQRILWIDTGKLQRGGVQIRALEGLDVATVSGRYNQLALLIHRQLCNCHFKDGVGLAVESPRLNVHYHG